MAELIANNKNAGWNPSYNTYVPTLLEDANIQDALKIFYYGNNLDDQTYETKSIYASFLSLEDALDTLNNAIISHTDEITTGENTHGVGVGNLVVGTGTTQELTNKTLISPKINENIVLSATSSELNILDGATLSTAELNTLDGITSTVAELNILHDSNVSATEFSYLNNVTSSIQTQLNSKANLSGGATFTGSIALPDTTTIGGKRIYIQSTQPTSPSNGDVWIQIG